MKSIRIRAVLGRVRAMLVKMWQTTLLHPHFVGNIHLANNFEEFIIIIYFLFIRYGFKNLKRFLINLSLATTENLYTRIYINNILFVKS